MGPRLISRGEQTSPRRSIRKPGCFNGATADQPWRAGGTPALADVLSRGFNGATADQPWRDHRNCCGFQASACFNGATADQPWRGRLWHVGRMADSPASMGPRLISRGEQKLHGIGGGLGGFNGATADQPWRARNPLAGKGVIVASMGPRLISRGESPCNAWPRLSGGGFNGATADQPWRATTPRQPTSPFPCFNGATADQPWRGKMACEVVKAAIASMGPRLISRGEDRTENPRDGSERLQWGHG